MWGIIEGSCFFAVWCSRVKTSGASSSGSAKPEIVQGLVSNLCLKTSGLSYRVSLEFGIPETPRRYISRLYLESYYKDSFYGLRYIA